MAFLLSACQNQPENDTNNHKQDKNIHVLIKKTKVDKWDEHAKNKWQELTRTLNQSNYEQIALLALTHNEQNLAKNIFIQLNKNSPGIDYDYYLAEIAISNNQFELANKLIINGLTKANNNDKNLLYLLRADMLITAGELTRAKKNIQSVLTVDPENIHALYLHSKIALATADCQSAIEDLSKLIQTLPDQLAFYQPLTSAYRMCGQNKRADQYAHIKTEETLVFHNRLLEKKQSVGNPVSNLKQQIKISISRKKYHEAIKLITKLLKIEPNVAATHVNLGSMYYNTSNLPAAKQAYLNALKLDAKHHTALLNIGIIAIHEKNLPLAEEYYLRAYAINPRHIKALLNIASIKQRLGKPEESEKYLQELLHIDATHTGARTSLIIALSMQGQYEKAYKTIEQWKKNEKNSLFLYQLNTKLFLQDHSFSKEIISPYFKQLEPLLKKSPQLSSYYLLLKHRYEKAFTPSQGMEQWQKLTELEPGSSESLRFFQMLSELQQNGHLSLRVFK